MLRDIKQKSSGLFAKIVMGLLIIAFGFWGISGSLMSSTNDSAATVNGEKITISEFNLANQSTRNRYKQQFGDSIGTEYFDTPNFKKGVMNQLVDKTLLKQEAEKFNFDVSPEKIANYIKSSPGLQVDGKFSAEAYANYLAQVNKSAELLERDIKEDLKSTALPQLVNQSGFALKAEIERQLKLAKQKRSIKYLELSTNDFKDKVDISDDEIESHYKEFGSDYKTQEKVSVNYIELSTKDLLDSIDVTDDELAEQYEAKKATMMTAEKRRAQHILMQVTDDNKEEVLKKISAIRAKLKAGENFDTLAKENSEDPGSAPKGGDLDWVTKGDMVKEFEDKLFSMKEGEISEPVLSNFGYHIIKLNEIQSPQIPQLADIKDKLIEELKKEKADDEFLRVADNLETAIIDSDNVLELVAENSGLSVKSTKLFAKGRGKGIAANSEFSKTAFSETVLNDNETSAMIDLGENHIAYVHLKEHKLPVIKPLEKVKSQIKEKLLTKKAKQLVEETLTNHLQEIKNGEKTLSEVAKIYEKEVVEANDVERTGSKLPYTLVKNIFALEKDTKHEMLESNTNAYALVDLLSVSEADLSKIDDSEKEKIQKQIERSVSSNEIIKITEQLRKDASININEKIFETEQ